MLLAKKNVQALTACKHDQPLMSKRLKLKQLIVSKMFLFCAHMTVYVGSSAAQGPTSVSEQNN